MSNTTRGKRKRTVILFIAAAISMAAVLCGPANAANASKQERTAMNSDQTLSSKQQAIAPIAAATAIGDMPRLNAALNEGLDAGLSVSPITTSESATATAVRYMCISLCGQVQIGA